MKHTILDFNWREHHFDLSFIAVSLATLVAVFYIYLDAREELNKAEVELNNQQSTNQLASDAFSLIKANLVPFKKLQNRGLVGHAQRLQWIELTEKISQELDILLVDFTLGKTLVNNTSISLYGSSELNVSTTTMDFALNLRHEGEFYRFMEALRLNAKGTFSVDECNIVRNPTSAGLHPELVGLTAKCRVTWYVIADISANWQAGQQ